MRCTHGVVAIRRNKVLLSTYRVRYFYTTSTETTILHPCIEDLHLQMIIMMIAAKRRGDIIMMQHQQRLLRHLHRRFTSANNNNNDNRPSFGFSGAGFLGSYHVGVASCLHKHGILPNSDEGTNNKMPILTGVSAGSMISAAICAGVQPEPDGMEVVLTAARRTRELQTNRNVSFDVLTPGFSLIDQVEGPFRDAMVKALGGYCETDESTGITTIHDIDPTLFASRFPQGGLRIGITDRRGLLKMQIVESYRYVDSFRNIEDVIACSMLSSYIPGITGALQSDNKVGVDTSYRAGFRLNEMAKLGMVKHGVTGSVVGEDNKDETATNYWDGGISDVFPTIDKDTVIVAPVNGVFDNPTICPRMPEEISDGMLNEDESKEDTGFHKQQSTTSTTSQATLLQHYLRAYLPTTFHHCAKSRLGLNTKNANALLKMIFSSDDDELYTSFREGYDDCKRYLKDRDQLRVISG